MGTQRASLARRCWIVCLFALPVAFVAMLHASGVTYSTHMSPPHLPESIAIDHQGNTYVSFPPTGQILKIAPDGTQSIVATLPRPTLGLVLDERDNLYVASAGSNAIWEIPAGGGTPAQIASTPGAPNGMAFDHRGNLFVAASRLGVIYRIARDHSVGVWASDTLLQGTSADVGCGVHPAGALGANGVVFNKHGDLLVTNTTYSQVVRIPVNPDGTAGIANIYAGPDCRLWGADGGAMDNEDNLYVAANAARTIVRVDPNGSLEVLAACDSPGGANGTTCNADPLFMPSAIAFGTGHGARKQIYITNFAAFTGGVGAGIVTMDVGVPGRPLR